MEAVARNRPVGLFQRGLDRGTSRCGVEVIVTSRSSCITRGEREETECQAIHHYGKED